MSEQIDGEWWIDDGGSVMYADGDIGDYNHEFHVMDLIHHQIADKVGYYKDDIDWEELKAFIEQQEYQEQYKLASPQVKQQLEQRWNKWHQTPQNNYSPWFKQSVRKHQIKDKEIALAEGFGDAREYAIKEWGWKRVQGHNVESWRLTPNDLKIIARGLGDIMEQEGIEPEAEQDPDFTFHVSIFSTGRSFELTMAQLEAGVTGTLSPVNADINRNQAAAMQQARGIERQQQLPFYRDKPIGDSVFTPKKLLRFYEWLQCRHGVIDLHGAGLVGRMGSDK